MEKFRSDLSDKLKRKQALAMTNNFCSFFDKWVKWIVVTVPLSALGSMWIAFMLIHLLGRMPVMLIGSLLLTVGGCLTAIFPNVAGFFIGLIFTGCGVGFLRQVIQLVCKEINVGDAPDRLSFAFRLAMTLGTLLNKGVGFGLSYYYLSGWRWCIGIACFLAAPIIVISLFLGETPHFLIKKGRLARAVRVLVRMRKLGAAREFEELSARLNNEEDLGMMPWRRLWYSDDCPVLVINVASSVFSGAIGVDTVVSFGALFLQSVKYDGPASFLATFVASMVRGIMACFTRASYRFGRRRILTITCLVMSTALFGLYGLLYGSDVVFHMKTQAAYAAGTLSMILVGGFSIFSGPSDWTVAAYANETRLLGQILEISASFILSIIMNLAAPQLGCLIRASQSLLSGFIVVCIGALVWFLIPGGVTSENWGQHRVWKKWVRREDIIVRRA